MASVGKITHFNRVSGVDGVYVGSSTAGETKVIDSSAVVYASAVYKNTAGTIKLSDKEITQSLILSMSTTVTQSWYTVAPVKANLVAGYAVMNLAAATANIVSVAMGTNGDNLAATTTGSCTVGTIFPMVMSATVAVAAGQLLKLTVTATATSVMQTYMGVVMVWDKT